ncbi:hypothetical protein TBLA_0B05720 [Henningerozyma blattae CBS 6284]|uniref:Altered inheritance of mitochondria protein 36, mitochondrial n=1 Tax=Henningerozyma blattae (strain ATCC 34711 / CBS 6284 / DSM 70876 / NBRC 10599 / NRRL Y-10934 / UCD 77-7) TaxID=1071380 RepID=I2GZ47_HENB6|nr:hypothetical protein TBLA_0B05720 [Tetrapisispora blattae CBS 6284]CCH59399.1 hypothetical protein TBLA_0B05720 [Tetrapisispora blattae CBS 6284]
MLGRTIFSKALQLNKSSVSLAKGSRNCNVFTNPLFLNRSHKFQSFKRYSTSKNTNKKSIIDDNTVVDRFLFLKIMFVGVVGTGIFMATVKTLNKKPKTSYSEQEYANVVGGLRRKIAVFPNNEVNVHFIVASDGNTAKIDKSFIKVIPLEVAESIRKDENNKYQALLQEYYEKYNDDTSKYFENLPVGMMASLLGQYLKNNSKPGDNIALIGYPLTIKEANIFENDVVEISKLVVSQKYLEDLDANDLTAQRIFDLVSYYDTVGKVDMV